MLSRSQGAKSIERKRGRGKGYWNDWGAVSGKPTLPPEEGKSGWRNRYCSGGTLSAPVAGAWLVLSRNV